MPAADIMSCSLGWNGSVDLEQFVVTGEPVAVMGGGAQSAVAKAGGASQPVLYVEFRKDGVPRRSRPVVGRKRRSEGSRMIMRKTSLILLGAAAGVRSEERRVGKGDGARSWS